MDSAGFQGKHFVRQTQRPSRCQCLEATVPGQPRAAEAEPVQTAAGVGLSVLWFGLVLLESDDQNQDPSQGGHVSRARTAQVLPAPLAVYLPGVLLPSRISTF